MQFSDSLEVGIGLSFIFFLSSLVLASIHEMIETVLKARGTYLFDGICELLDDPDPTVTARGESIAKTIYQHPLVRGLMRGNVGQADFRKNLPSYLPTRSFVLALIDQAAQGKLTDASSRGSAPAAGTRVQQLRMLAEGIPNGQVRTALTHAIDTASGDIDTVAANLEHWFDSAMDRVSGWYKRRSQRIIFVLGLGSALLLNVNTITIAQSLMTSSTLRHAVASVAEARERKCIDDGRCLRTPSTAQVVAEMDGTNLPVGWTGDATHALLAPTLGRPVLGWFEILAGYLLTAFAVTLGAPFWFDVLNRLMVIRATVKPTEKSVDEGSQDPQPPLRTGPVINVLPSAPNPAPDPRSVPRPPDPDIYVDAPGAAERLFEDDSGAPVYGHAAADGAVP